MGANGEVGGPDTLSLEDCEPDRAAVAAPAQLPHVGWDRYELLELLGTGGMGEVYKARDRRLGRLVAIKLVLGADPNLAVRFVREARAQARLDHPNICRIYEVGERDGRAYLALQLVDGEPLHRAAATMSLDDKIGVLRDVAAAIHEAHRLGIVHRDLKPGNILVERGADARWLPVVMDFGLAREATVEAGLTVSGAVLGTPAYMSPEQARGDGRAVDRRTDIYGLGATLYELLTGRPPFPVASLAVALQRVIHDDPPAPRSLAPGVPVDLETIALKCLAKDPSARYPSARALADDLGRYLDGEPILGRRRSLWQRARQRTRRHRALVVLGAWSLAALGAVAALGISAWLDSRAERARNQERAVLAERLGSDAKDIEQSLRMAYLLPLHDAGPDRERIRALMQRIAGTRHDLGARGDAIVHNALGRGHLALHEWREAADELALGEAAGPQPPELHAARGRALGELYHRELEAARWSGDNAWLERRKQQLAQRYLAPALAELGQSAASGDDAELLAALVALYRGDFAGAERVAGAVAARDGSSFEAHRLAGDAAYGAAIAAFDHGQYDAAREALERAGARYAGASEIARSDASLYEAAARAWLQRAEVDFRQGREQRAPLEHALDALDHALRAEPGNADDYTTRSYALLRWCQTPSLREPGDVHALLDRSAGAAQRAVEFDPRNARAWDALGNAHVYRGIYEHDHGGHGAAWWTRAVDEIGKALALQPDDPWVSNDLGVAHRWRGADLERTGADPMPEYEAALRWYARATALEPDYLYAWENQAELHTSIAEHQAALGIDPRPAVERATAASESCLAIDPNFYSMFQTLARAQLVLADYQLDAGGEPGAAIAAARNYLARTAAVRPGLMADSYQLAVAARVEAAFQLGRGVAPTSALATGRAALAEARRLAPGSPYPYVEAARIGLVAATWEARSGRDALPALREARAAADQAVTLDGRLADALLAAAEVSLRLAIMRPSPAIIDRGVAYADQLLAQHPRLPRAQAVRAALLKRRVP